MDRNENTEEWALYQQGLDYNNKVNLYALTELHWNFYNSKQWGGVVTNGLSKWTFNICRSAINYIVASICSQKTKIQYSAENIPDDPEDEMQAKIKETVQLMSDAIDLKWEKEKMDSKLRELLLDGAVAKDFCTITLWDKDIKTGQTYGKKVEYNEAGEQIEKPVELEGDFTTEVVDGCNVMFGNPNSRIVERQPYILVVRREMVADLKKRAKANGIAKDLIDTITTDNENTYQAGEYGKIELDSKNENGKALSILKFWKKDGQCYWNESTKSCPICKDVDLGISRYPIAWGNWESVKNSYHGMAAIDGIIDNQIQINVLFAIISQWMKMNAFGKVAYDSHRITSWSNAVGTAIPVNGDTTGVIQQLQAGNFNAAALTVIDMAIKYTKDFIGANDAALGQVNPEQASGIAIVSTAKQSAIPLENIMANRDQFVEDWGLIQGEFMLKKYNNRKLSYRKDGKLMMKDFNTEGMENILLQCKVDVGPSSYWSEIASVQTLSNLFEQGKITDVEYFERMPKGMIPDVQGLIDARKALQQQEANQQAEFEQMAAFVEGLPPDVQQRLDMVREQDPAMYEQAVRQLMQQGQPQQQMM